MLFIILLDSVGDKSGISVNWGKFFKIPHDLGKLSVGSGLDDILVNLLLFF
jgi:hypothetical protein